MDAAIKHCDVGIGIWDWASNDPDGSEPDVVMACAGDVPTLETIAAVELLRVVLDESANRARRMRITAEASRIRVYVIPTDEEKMIARHTLSHIC